jgi:hypothetical protein
VSFGGESRGTYVGHPNLHRPQALAAQACTMRSYALARRRSFISHTLTLHVTLPGNIATDRRVGTTHGY